MHSSDSSRWRMPRTASLALVLCLAGCTGGSRLPKPNTVPVTGKVTFKGEAVADATVSFVPTGSHRSAYAKTDAAGAYKLNTAGNNDGAMPGDYQVIVTKSVSEGAAASNDIAAPQQPVKFKSLLPEKYAQASSSGLTASVKKDGANRFDFSLSE